MTASISLANVAMKTRAAAMQPARMKACVPVETAPVKSLTSMFLIVSYSSLPGTKGMMPGIINRVVASLPARETISAKMAIAQAPKNVAAIRLYPFVMNMRMNIPTAPIRLIGMSSFFGALKIKPKPSVEKNPKSRNHGVLKVTIWSVAKDPPPRSHICIPIPTPPAMATAVIQASTRRAVPESISPESRSRAAFVIATPGRKIVVAATMTGEILSLAPNAAAKSTMPAAPIQLINMRIKSGNFRYAINAEIK